MGLGMALIIELEIFRLAQDDGKKDVLSYALKMTVGGHSERSDNAVEESKCITPIKSLKRIKKTRGKKTVL